MQQRNTDRPQRDEKLVDAVSAYMDSDAHGRRTAWLAARIWRAMGLDRDSEDLLVAAATYHDVGKFFVFSNNRKGESAPGLRQITPLRYHTWYGRDFFMRTSRNWVQAEVAMLHHERWDGRGYPLQLQRNQIPIMARVTAVADVFDALTSERRYEPAWSIGRSIGAIVSARETQFDPACVDGFALLANELASGWTDVTARLSKSIRARISPDEMNSNRQASTVDY